MAEPTSSHPEDATLGGASAETEPGERALREALGKHGDRLAEAVEATDDVDDLLATAILIVASADEAEVANVTESLGALVEAGDGLLTDDTADLATTVGENAADLDDALALLLDLQQSGDLEDLLETARVLAVLDIDEETARGLNRLLGAVGEAEQSIQDESGGGLLDSLRSLGSQEVRDGVRFLVELLRGLGDSSNGR
jgi:uncharacterized protein YjgD (DUF1641 family)